MSNQLDKTLALQARRDLASLEGFLNVLETQVTVLYDNLPGDDDGHREQIEQVEEAGRELLAIARSIRIASTMVSTTHNDFEVLMEQAFPSVRPVFSGIG